MALHYLQQSYKHHINIILLPQLELYNRKKRSWFKKIQTIKLLFHDSRYNWWIRSTYLKQRKLVFAPFIVIRFLQLIIRYVTIPTKMSYDVRRLPRQYWYNISYIILAGLILIATLISKSITILLLYGIHIVLPWVECLKQQVIL